MALIVQSGARQYLVTPGQHVIVNRIPGEVGAIVQLEMIAAFGDEASVNEVFGKIIGHQRSEKVIVAKYKPKSNYRRRYGPRQKETVLEIVLSKSTTAAKKAEKVETKAPKTAKKTTAKKATKKTTK